jgi:hypothetical protein
MNKRIFKIKKNIFYEHKKLFKILYNLRILNNDDLININFYTISNNEKANKFNEIEKYILR